MNQAAWAVQDRVSRETCERLAIYVEELRRWQRAINLVSPATLDAVWERHVDDCLQLADLHPQARSWVDLGSGAGLPGLIIAAVDPANQVVLVESDKRKCAFLRSTAARMGVTAEVREQRIEAVPRPDPPPDIVTARGLASLSRLFAYAQPLLGPTTVCVFPKGRRYEEELTEARESWSFVAEAVESRTDRDARIIRVTGLRPSTRILRRTETER